MLLVAFSHCTSGSKEEGISIEGKKSLFIYRVLLKDSNYVYPITVRSLPYGCFGTLIYHVMVFDQDSNIISSF